jgi:hypothetical protein
MGELLGEREALALPEAVALELMLQLGSSSRSSKGSRRVIGGPAGTGQAQPECRFMTSDNKNKRRA